jgi:light-regulated signal transduction histidine kinase (bacteriophytochrome)
MIIEQHGEVRNLEIQQRRFDGSPIWVQSTARGVRDTGGQMAYYEGSVVDVTERKKAQDEILRLNAELEQRVIERTAQLETANRELEAFSYSVSHDLRAPIRAINGFARLLADDYHAALPENARHYLQQIRSSGQRTGELIDDLLMFSRLGRQQLSRRPVNMDTLVQQALADLRADYADRSVEFDIAELPDCQADAGLLRQVLVNLIGNALKFTRHIPLPKIEINWQASGAEVIYFVRDNGVGFDMQYAHKLFGVFQRLHQVEDYEGTGVGLALAQRILQKHHGRIWAEAALNRGATFYFTLGD